MKKVHLQKEGSTKILCFVLALVLIIGSLSIASSYASETEAYEQEALAAAAETAGEEESADVETPELETESEPEMESEPETESEPYINSISGMLWVDMYDDFDNNIYAGDGIRQTEEQPLGGYTVSLYRADDTSAALRTAITAADGIYAFTNLELGSYVVGITSTTIDGIEYLLPLVGISGDNRFTMASDYVNAYSGMIHVDADTVVSDIDAGMRTPPTPQLQAAGVTVSYYGRLVDQNGTPICNAPIFMAVLYTTDAWGNYGAKTNTASTDNNGYFSFSTIVAASTALSWDDTIYFAIGFPSQFPANISAPYAGNVSGTENGLGSLTLYRNAYLSTASSSYPTSFARTLYKIASYDLRALDSSLSITIGSTSSRQDIRVNGIVQHTVTENYYGLDTGTTPLRLHKLSSFGSFYATNNFTGTKISSTTYNSKTYTYIGYRLDTTSGSITEENPPLSYPISSDLAVNYYYTPPNSYIVIEKYVDTAGNLIASDNPVLVASGANYSYGGSPPNITSGGNVYVYQGYKVGSYTPGAGGTLGLLDGTGTPTIQSVKANSTVYFVYDSVSVATVDVTVSKTVTGDYADTTKVFTFIVYFQDDTGAPLSTGTQFSYTGGVISGSGAMAPANGTLTLDSAGKATFELQHGQTITIADVATNSKVQIEEADYSSSYSTTFIDSEVGASEPGADTGFRGMTSSDRIFDFTNARYSVVPTGITADSGGMVLLVLLAILAVAVGLAITVLCRRRARAS